MAIIAVTRWRPCRSSEFLEPGRLRNITASRKLPVRRFRSVKANATMSEQVNAVPQDYPGVTAYLVIRGAAAAIDFYRTVFGAEEILRLAAPDGSIGHAELRVAGGVVMLADEVPDMDIKAPPTIGGSSVGLMVYVDDADAVFNAAIEAGAQQFKPMCDQFYGDRSGTLDDPFGHRWTIASRIENVTPADIAERFNDLYGDD